MRGSSVVSAELGGTLAQTRQSIAGLLSDIPAGFGKVQKFVPFDRRKTCEKMCLLFDKGGRSESGPERLTMILLWLFVVRRFTSERGVIHRRDAETQRGKSENGKWKMEDSGWRMAEKYENTQSYTTIPPAR